MFQQRKQCDTKPNLQTKPVFLFFQPNLLYFHIKWYKVLQLVVFLPQHMSETNFLVLTPDRQTLCVPHWEAGREVEDNLLSVLGLVIIGYSLKVPQIITSVIWKSYDTIFPLVTISYLFLGSMFPASRSRPLPGPRSPCSWRRSSDRSSCCPQRTRGYGCVHLYCTPVLSCNNRFCTPVPYTRAPSTRGQHTDSARESQR